MQETLRADGMLSAHPPAPGIDPLDAVAAVSDPRADAGRQPLAETDPVDIQVATTVSLDSVTRPQTADERAEAGNSKDAYSDLALPDGFVADPEAMAKFTPLAKKYGLSREAAEELARLHVELDDNRNRAQAEFIARNNSEWLREIQNHPEFGGRRLRETGEKVASVLRQYGSPLLLAQIRQMNIQNWPEMFYFLARISQNVGEDSSPSGNGGDAAVKSTAQLLFPGLK